MKSDVIVEHVFSKSVGHSVSHFVFSKSLGHSVSHLRKRFTYTFVQYSTVSYCTAPYSIIQYSTVVYHTVQYSTRYQTRSDTLRLVSAEFNVTKDSNVFIMIHIWCSGVEWQPH